MGMGGHHGTGFDLTVEALKYLDHDEMRGLIIRMLDQRIKKKKAMIEALQEKIETYNMVRTIIQQKRA
jgi:hypothetical protein